MVKPREEKPGKPSAVGVVVVLILMFTAIIGAVCIIFPGFLFFPFCRKVYWSFAQFLLCVWLYLAVFMVEYVCNVRVFFTGDWDDALSNRGENAVVISNHNNRLDWLFLFSAFSRLSMLEAIKIVLKAEMKGIPGLGWCHQAFLFVFVERKWEKDKIHLANLYHYYQACQQRFVLLIFPEGSDLSDTNIVKSHAWSEKCGTAKKHYVLHPRSKGFVETVRQLRGGTDAVYDFTLGYVNRGGRANEKRFLANSLPSEVHFSPKVIHKKIISHIYERMSYQKILSHRLLV